mgnify:CR=1 FL=1
MRLQVRYSAYCDAVWGRILRGEPGDQLTLRFKDGSARSALIDYGSDQFTMMSSVGESFSVKVCAVPTTAAKRTGEWTYYCIYATDRNFPQQDF